LNRAGSNLPARDKAILTRAKEELRRLYHRPPARPPARRRK
jgi:hypothetical protein